MHTNLEESAITQLLQVLWRSRGALGNAGLGDDIAIGMSVPPTVVYEHNFPKGMFFAGHDGLLSRRVGKDTDSKTLFHIFTEPNAPPRRRAAAKRSTGGGGGGGEGSSSPTHNNNSKAAAAHHSNSSSRLDNIVAVYTEKSPDGDRYTATYFTEGTLESFLLGGVHTDESRPSSFSSGGGGGSSSTHNPPPSKNGILQKFHEPIGKHNEVIQVLWTPHMCIAEKLRSRVALHDVSKTPFERAATVEAPASSCTRAYVAPEIANKLRQQCETLAEQLYVTERRLIQQMTLYFKVDAFGHLWFLWSPYLRFATHSSSGGGGGNKNSSHGGHLSDATSMLRHSAPSLPSFVVPSEVAGTTTASKKSHGPSSPSGGVHQHRIVSNTTFATYDDETVLKVPLPVLPSRCLSTPCTGSSFVAPTKSRLCPKMTWLQQKPSSSGGAGGGGLSLTATFNRSEHFEQIRQQLLMSSNNNNNSPYRSQHLSRGGGGGPAMEGSANVGLANVSAKREPSMLHSVATPLASRVASPMIFHGSSLSMDVSPVQKSRNSASLRGGGGGGLVPNFTMQDLKDLRQARDERQSWLRLADPHHGGLDVSDTSTGYRSVIDVLRRNRPASMARDGGDSSAASLETSRSQLHTPTSPSIHNAIRELSPSRVQAQETLTSKQCEGDLQDEIYLLRQLLRRPIPRGVRATLKSIQHLEDAKASMEICGQFVANVRDAAAMHFTEAVEIPSKGIALPPFAFSVPMPLLDAQDVAAAVIKLCSDTFEMQQVPIGEAIAISRANGRFVPYDLCSMHLDPCFHQEAPPSLSRPASSPPRATATVVATTATATTTHQLPSSASESSRNNNNTNSENGKETQKEGGRPPTAPPQQQQQQQQENQNVVDVNGGQEEGEGTSLLQERQEEVEGNRNDDVPAPPPQKDEGNPPEEAASTDPHVVADDEGGAPSEHTPAPSSSAAEMNEPKASKEDGEGNNNNNNNMNNMNNAEIQQQQQQQHHSTSKEDREDILNNGSTPPTTTVEDDRRRIAPVCFVMRTPATLTSFMSRLSPFLVVTLRNLHAMIEGSLR